MRLLLISLQEIPDVLGLKGLHYYLRAQGIDSHLLLLPRFDAGDERGRACLGRFVEEHRPGLVGVGLMSVEYRRARALTRTLRELGCVAPVVWGGIHPTLDPEPCLADADYVCVGEGERCLLELIEHLEHRRPLRAVSNLAYCDEDGVQRNPLAPLITELDSLPSYEHVPVSTSLQERSGRIVDYDRRVHRRWSRYRGTIYNIVGTRGCPYACTYCCNNYLGQLYQTRRVRRRSAAHILAELERALGDHPELQYVNFQDDSFLSQSDEALERFCAGYRRRVGRPFIVRAQPSSVTQRKLTALTDAGLAWISMGLQSGSDRVNREIFGRRVPRETFLRVARQIHQHGLAAFYDVILDNPFETDEDRLETVQTLARIPRPFYTQLFSLTFYPGTELHARAAREHPERMGELLDKNYHAYQPTPLNELTRLATVLSPGQIEHLVRLYREQPGSTHFRLALAGARVSARVLLEPITAFHVIRRSQGGDAARALRVLPNYLEEGLRRTLDSLRGGA